MMQATLRHTQVADTIFWVEFRAEINGRQQCSYGNEHILHTLTIRNPTWGVRIRNFTVTYRADTKSVQLCPGLTPEICAEGGQEVTIRIPAVPQEYWGGDQKSIPLRACMPKEGGDVDFNVSYKVAAEFDIRGGTQKPPDAANFESNMYVKVG